MDIPIEDIQKEMGRLNVLVIALTAQNNALITENISLKTKLSSLESSPKKENTKRSSEA